MDIHPPFCTVLFTEYQTYDQVPFSHLKVIPRDQQLVSLFDRSINVHVILSFLVPRCTTIIRFTSHPFECLLSCSSKLLFVNTRWLYHHA